MDDRSVCTPQLAESDAHNNSTSSPHATSVTDADKVINTKIDSTQVEGLKSEDQFLKGLLTDDYCHMCNAMLLFESQRLSHYEGKKHAQKLKVYLQGKRAEKMTKEATTPKQMMSTDKDSFCELCNMVFSSQIVARSHYEGKVHTKNLRKQGLQPHVTGGQTKAHNLPSLSQDPDDADQKSAPEGTMEHLDSTATTITHSTEVNLKDPNKYCALCAASFNNIQVALQHYKGRKHQKNQSRQELLKNLGNDDQQVNPLMCPMCNVPFNSVEMYQAHMRGNKHHTREKKVVDLCNSQQNVNSTFADELTEYIQIQKARGITPRPQALAPGDAEKEDEGDGKEAALTEGNVLELSRPMPNFPPIYKLHHHSNLGCYNQVERWRPSNQGPLWPSHPVEYNCPPPNFQGSSSPLFTNWPAKRRRRRKPSSTSSDVSSSSYSSSYSSSFSSSTSDDDNEHRHRQKRRIKKSRKERDNRTKEDDLVKEEKRLKRQRRKRDNESEERRENELGELEEEMRRKKRKIHDRQRRQDKKLQVEDCETVGGERMMDSLKSEEITDNRIQTDVHIQADVNVDLGACGQDKVTKPKNRRETKKTKEKVDTRTEEEKLWDESILGF